MKPTNNKIYGRVIYFGLITINRTFTNGAKAYDWYTRQREGWRAKHAVCGLFYDKYLTKPMIQGSEAVLYAQCGINGMYNLLTDTHYE
jgi:hypothetical protein